VLDAFGLTRLDAADIIDYWRRHTQLDWTREHDLLACLMIDAVNCIRAGCSGKTWCHHCEAIDWIHGADATVSFANVCAIFDLDATAVVRAILKPGVPKRNMKQPGNAIYKMYHNRTRPSRVNGKWRNL
jgi:hypothetical protein